MAGCAVDRYFKDYFWTFVLAALAVGAFLLAHLANALVGGALAPPAEGMRAAGPAQAAPTQRGPPSVSAFLLRNIFHAEREELDVPPPKPQVEDAAATKEPPDDYDPERCDPSSMSVQVFALFASDRPHASVAILKTGSDGQFRSYRVGDNLEDAEIRSIGWRSIRMRRSGHCELLSLDDLKKTKPSYQSPPKVASKSSKSRPGSTIGDTVKKTGANEYMIPRNEIDNVLSNLNQVATQARIVPNFKNGKSNGFKLFAIRPNSLYTKIGIKNGDVVQRINGYELDSPDKALQIYSKLKDASNISVDLVRRGHSKSLNYNIR